MFFTDGCTPKEGEVCYETTAAYLITYNGQMHALDPKHPEAKNAAVATETIWNER